MKIKRIGLLLLAVLALGLTGCRGRSAETAPVETAPVATASPTPTPTPPPTPEPTPVPLDEQAEALLREGDFAGAAALLETAPEGELTRLKLLAALGRPAVGDRIVFGRYEQNGEEADGAEEIEWLVLDTDGERVLLVSCVSLDTRPYHTEETAVTWAECELRQWLNGAFKDAAFSEDEQALLCQTQLVNADNAVYGTPGGEDTVDRVFLLSFDEAERYLPEREQRISPMCAAAVMKGGFRSGLGASWWWLRSSGVYGRDAAYVNSLGELSSYGYIVSRPGWAIRPALWLDLSV